MSPGGPSGPAVDVPVGHDAAADSRADLDQEQVLGLAPMHPMLAAGHDVDVVVDEHRRGVAALEPLRDREVVPARHDRRVDGPPAGELDRAGDADADPADLVSRPADLVEQFGEALVQPLEGALRPDPDVEVACPLRERRPDQVAHRDAGMRCSQVGGEDDPGVAIEHEHGRRPTAGGDAAAGVVDEPFREQGVDSLGHRRAGETGHPGQVRPGDGDLFADQVEEGTSARR